MGSTRRCTRAPWPGLVGRFGRYDTYSDGGGVSGIERLVFLAEVDCERRDRAKVGVTKRLILDSGYEKA